MTPESMIANRRIRSGIKQKSKPSVGAGRCTPLPASDHSALTSSAVVDSLPDVELALPKTVTRYHRDADIRAVLDAHAVMAAKAIENITAVDAGKQSTPADALKWVLNMQGKDGSGEQGSPTALAPGAVSFDEHNPGPAGELSVRIHLPPEVGPFAVVVYFHGGEWVLADKSVYDSGARGVAKYASAMLICVDYGFAPEAAFSAQHEDALAAYSQSPLSPGIARKMLSPFHSQTPRTDPDLPALTTRESEVLRFISKGMTLPETARLLQLSRHTVDGYVKDIYRKLNVSSRAEAALSAQQMGLV